MDSEKVKFNAKGSSKNDIYVLVIGETGSGKSTFINYLANYFNNGSLKNLRVAIPTKYLSANVRGVQSSTESNVKDSSKSQTQGCTTYPFKLRKHDSTLHIIDTPGLSDTRGMEQDDKNLKLIFDAAENAPSLAALILVINGSSCRINSSMKNVFVRFRNSLPDVVLENMMIVFTNCLPHTRTFEEKLLKDLTPSKEFFHMQNSAFSTNPVKWNDEWIKSLSQEWTHSMEVIDKLANALAQKVTVSTSAFKNMRDLRMKVQQTLHNSRLQFSQLQQLQEQLEDAKKKLGKFNNDEKAFANYTQKKTMQVRTLVDASYHSTICSTCNTVCHDHCGLSEISTTGSNAFKGCYAMNGADNCHVCEGKCSYTVHYHARKTMQTVEQSIEEVLEDMKKKYDAAVKGRSSADTDIKTTNGAVDLVRKAVEQHKKDLERDCQGLKKICRGFNLVDELNVVVDQLEKESRALTSLEARKTADAYIKKLKFLCDNLSKEKSSFDNSHDDDSSDDERYQPSSNRGDRNQNRSKKITRTSLGSSDDDRRNDRPSYKKKLSKNRNDGSDSGSDSDEDRRPNRKKENHKSQKPERKSADKDDVRAKTVCQYFLKNSCNRGDGCNFIHALLPENIGRELEKVSKARNDRPSASSRTYDTQKTPKDLTIRNNNVTLEIISADRFFRFMPPPNSKTCKFVIRTAHEVLKSKEMAKNNKGEFTVSYQLPKGNDYYYYYLIDDANILFEEARKHAVFDGITYNVINVQ